MNGRIWIKCHTVMETIAVANAISVSQHMTNQDIQKMCSQMADSLVGFWCDTVYCFLLFLFLCIEDVFFKLYDWQLKWFNKQIFWIYPLVFISSSWRFANNSSWLFNFLLTLKQFTKFLLFSMQTMFYPGILISSFILLWKGNGHGNAHTSLFSWHDINKSLFSWLQKIESFFS